MEMPSARLLDKIYSNEAMVLWILSSMSTYFCSFLLFAAATLLQIAEAAPEAMEMLSITLVPTPMMK